MSRTWRFSASIGALLWFGASSGSAAAEWRGSMRATLGPEWDSNAPRAIRGDQDARNTPVSDGLMRLTAEGEGAWRPSRRFTLDGRLLVGAKRFFGAGEVRGGASTASEDVLTVDGRVAPSLRFGRTRIELLQGARMSRVRSGGRDYGLARTALTVTRAVTASVAVGLRGGFLRFDYPTDPTGSFDHTSAHAGLFGRLRLGDRWRWDVQARALYREYDGAGGDPDLFERDVNRRDLEGQLGTGILFRGPVQLGLRYLWRVQRSAAGGAVEFDRHRVSASVAFRAPGRFLVSALGSLQFNFGQTDAVLAEADENQNSVQVQVRRPLSDQVSVDVRYAFYGNQFQGGQTTGAPLQFERHTVFGGLTVFVEAAR